MLNDVNTPRFGIWLTGFRFHAAAPWMPRLLAAGCAAVVSPIYYKISILNWALKKQALRILCELCALCGLNLLGSDSIIRSHDEHIITAKLTLRN